jgi:hypothetical protein
LVHSPEGDRVEGEIQTASWSYETQVNFPTSRHNTRPTARHFIKRTSRTS